MTELPPYCDFDKTARTQTQEVNNNKTMLKELQTHGTCKTICIFCIDVICFPLNANIYFLDLHKIKQDTSI